MKNSCLKKLIINVFLFFSFEAWADATLDRKYELGTVGYLQAWDNVDGLFAEYVDQSYKDFFLEESRFKLQTLSRGDSILQDSKISYRELIDDSQVLAQLSRSLRVQSLIRTKIYKEGPRYRFVIDWLHAPKMDLLASYTFYYKEPPPNEAMGGELLRQSIFEALEKLLGQVPFLGQVTGRDGPWVTVNIGRRSRLKKGDIIVLGTIRSVDSHPLLKKLVNWKFDEVGKLEVDEVDDRIAFAQIKEEDSGERIWSYQKILRIIPKAEVVKMTGGGSTDKDRTFIRDKRPSLGFLAGGLLLGSSSRQISISSSSGQEGSGTLIGAHGEGQLWLTQSFFADLGVGFGSFGYTQTDIGGTGTEREVGATLVFFNFALGYMHLFSNSFFGPKGWVRVGYHSRSYSMPVGVATLSAPTSFGGTFLGLGGDIPFTEKWGGLITFDLGLFLKGYSIEGLENIPGKKSISDFSFQVGPIYRWKSTVHFRALLSIYANSVDLDGGNSISHSTLTLGPSALFYF